MSHLTLDDDIQHLRDAIAVAHEARTMGNHPFGAVVVLDGVEIARASNSVVTTRDATAHAEMNVLRRIAAFEHEQFADATLYASTEPCVMCSGAIYWVGIRRIVYGCSAKTLAQLAGGDFMVPCRSILKNGAHDVEVVGPVIEEEAIAVHRGFWR